MNGEHLVVNNRRYREVVKHIGKVLPDHSIPILGLTLHIEPIVLRDRPGLMIPPDHMHLRGVLDLEQAQKRDDFHGMRASVDEIAQEQVTRVGQVPADLEDLQDVVKLAVDVADDGDGGGEVVDVLLFDEDVLEFVAD